jgi:hypothetical protein
MNCDEIGQPPADKTATISRGDDYALLLAFKSNNVAINLTGWSFDARFKKTGQTDVVMTATSNAQAGTVTFAATDAQTTAMVGGANKNDLAGRWQMVIKGTDPNGNTRRYLTATVYVLN